MIIKYKSRQGAKKNPCLLQIRGKGSNRRNGGNGFRAIYISFLPLTDPNRFLGEGNQKGLSPSHKAVSNTCTPSTPSSSQTTGTFYNFLTLQILGSAETAPVTSTWGLICSSEVLSKSPSEPSPNGHRSSYSNMVGKCVPLPMPAHHPLSDGKVSTWCAWLLLSLLTWPLLFSFTRQSGGLSQKIKTQTFPFQPFGHRPSTLLPGEGDQGQVQVGKP